MAFALKNAVAQKAGVVSRSQGRKTCVAVRAGKYDEELIKTAVSAHRCCLCVFVWRAMKERGSSYPVSPFSGGLARSLPPSRCLRAMCSHACC
jgi:hypothetical protein